MYFGFVRSLRCLRIQFASRDSVVLFATARSEHKDLSTLFKNTIDIAKGGVLYSGGDRSWDLCKIVDKLWGVGSMINEKRICECVKNSFTISFLLVDFLSEMSMYSRLFRNPGYAAAFYWSIWFEKYRNSMDRSLSYSECMSTVSAKTIPDLCNFANCWIIRCSVCCKNVAFKFPQTAHTVAV